MCVAFIMKSRPGPEGEVGPVLAFGFNKRSALQGMPGELFGCNIRWGHYRARRLRIRREPHLPCKVDYRMFIIISTNPKRLLRELPCVVVGPSPKNFYVNSRMRLPNEGTNPVASRICYDQNYIILTV